MTIEQQILRDLMPGQSTADSTAGRLRIATEAAEVIMKRLAKDGDLQVLTIAEKLTVYRLTPEIRQEIADADRFHQQPTPTL